MVGTGFGDRTVTLLGSFTLARKIHSVITDLTCDHHHPGVMVGTTCPHEEGPLGVTKGTCTVSKRGGRDHKATQSPVRYSGGFKGWAVLFLR